jgi:hypothetical protein
LKSSGLLGIFLNTIEVIIFVSLHFSTKTEIWLIFSIFSIFPLSYLKILSIFPDQNSKNSKTNI